MVSKNLVDIRENDIIKYDRELLPILLHDNSSNQNILWATDNYTFMGEEYEASAPIQCKLVTGRNGDIIKPRVSKSKEEQLTRTRGKAEVFSPSWLCNRQNNLVDNAWFGVEGLFNHEIDNHWETNLNPIPFPTADGKTWKDYVKNIRMEITCGEAPYLASRYDAITGETIAVADRIGLLDRKLRVVSENLSTKKAWCKWAIIAFQSIYGYEWQGDNLLIARENLLFTFIDHYQAKFQSKPSIKYLKIIAEIISWNIWQMDGLKFVIPNSCTCNHNGIYCEIKDWNAGKTVKFVSLLKK